MKISLFFQEDRSGNTTCKQHRGQWFEFKWLNQDNIEGKLCPGHNVYRRDKQQHYFMNFMKHCHEDLRPGCW